MTIIHHVFANRSNIGDWLSARGIQALLGPVAVREHLCDDPFVADTIEALGRMGEDDLVVVGGGGLFMDYFTPLWEALLAVSPHVRYCIWGAGFCDLKAEPSRPDMSLLEAAVRGSAFCVVRDRLSRELLARCGLPEPVGCPSAAAVPRIPHAGRGVLHVDNYSTVGAAAYEVMHETARDYARRTAREYRTTNNRVRPDSEAEMRRVLGAYAASDVVVSSALHGCILALATGRRVVAVSGDWKIESFMESVGLSEWVLDAADVDRLGDLLEAVPTQPAADARLDRMRRENAGIAERIRALLNTDGARPPGAAGLIPIGASQAVAI